MPWPSTRSPSTAPRPVRLVARGLVGSIGALALAALVASCGRVATSPRPADPGPAPSAAAPPAAGGLAAVAAPDASAPPAGVAAPEVPVVTVEAPPFAPATPSRVKGTAVEGRTVLRLRKVSETPNQVTDEAAWFAAHGVSLPTLGGSGPGGAGPRPPAVPASFHGEPFLVALETSDEGLLALYGSAADGARWVVLLGDDGQARSALDFAAFRRAPIVNDDERFVTQGVHWAVLSKGVLYVSSYHRTYAKSSGGANAFVTAVDPATGAIRWQSAPLVANAADFLLWDGFVVTGYGFTAEPDHVFVLDQATGATLATTPVKSGPAFLVRKGDRLLVRTYDTDVVFDVE